MVEDADEAVLDLDVNFRAFFDVLGEGALGGDDEVVTTVGVLVMIDKDVWNSARLRSDETKRVSKLTL